MSRRTRHRVVAFALVALLAALLPAAIAGGQTEGEPPAAEPAPDEPTLQEKLTTREQQVAAELEQVVARIAEAGEPPPAELVRERDLLQRIDPVRRYLGARLARTACTDRRTGRPTGENEWCTQEDSNPQPSDP